MSKLFDAYDAPDVAAQADAIKAAGYAAVGLYYFSSSQFKRLLTKAVAEQISAAGLFIVSIWENGTPTRAAYFTAARGAWDGRVASEKATEAGQPAGTVIYPTVDYDAEARDLPAISEYFRAFRAALASTGYTTGVYGSGLVCRTLKDQKLVVKTWLSQSHGFQEFAAWLPFADIAQGKVTRLFGVDADLDTAAPTGGGGWRLG